MYGTKIISRPSHDTSNTSDNKIKKTESLENLNIMYFEWGSEVMKPEYHS
jgi:hypothetical protein